MLGKKTNTTGIDVIPLDTWDEFKTLITRVISDRCWGGLGIDSFWFRGLPTSHFELESSFDRGFKPLQNTRKKKDIVDHFVEGIRERLRVLDDWGPGEPLVGADDSIDELLGMAQHLGIQTRLLDWSESPYVGAFFALSDFESVVLSNVPADLTNDEVGDIPSHCAIWVLNTAAAAWNSDTGVNLVTPSRARNRRIQRQLGSFTRNMSTHDTLEQYCNEFYSKNQSDEIALRKLVLPRSETRLALRDLELMGISSESLFPGPEGAFRYALFRAIDKVTSES